MLISMVSWAIRFALFGLSGNSIAGFALIVASCIVYGMAFDFFNISGALFVEKNTSAKIQSSAQGVFMLMTNGIGAVLGNVIAGQVIAKWFEKDGTMLWNVGELSAPQFVNIWFVFAAYSLVVAILFAVLFKHKHNAQEITTTSH
jgi:NHS family xanthosine MFS transporter